MDLFALVLLILTLLTLCGICLFIFTCSLQPRITHYFHRKTNRTYHITSSKTINRNDDQELNGRRFSVISIDRDRRAYIKILERSVRTGRPIQHEIDDPCIPQTGKSSLRHYLNKHLLSTTTENNHQIIEI